jgi:hypothetical protein
MSYPSESFPDLVCAEESSSTAHRTVVVTRVVGTKVVTGTPPPSSTSAAARTSEVRSSSPSVAVSCRPLRLESKVTQVLCEHSPHPPNLVPPPSHPPLRHSCPALLLKLFPPVQLLLHRLSCKSRDRPILAIQQALPIADRLHLSDQFLCRYRQRRLNLRQLFHSAPTAPKSRQVSLLLCQAG